MTRATFRFLSAWGCSEPLEKPGPDVRRAVGSMQSIHGLRIGRRRFRLCPSYELLRDVMKDKSVNGQ